MIYKVTKSFDACFIDPTQFSGIRHQVKNNEFPGKIEIFVLQPKLLLTGKKYHFLSKRN